MKMGSTIGRHFPTLRRILAPTGAPAPTGAGDDPTTRRGLAVLRLPAAPFRWFFRSRRRVWTSAAILLAMLAAPPIWWSIQLVGLPDIGEPFDVAAFRATTIPDDRNAFVLYHQAAAQFRASGTAPPPRVETIPGRRRWATADPSVRRWVEANRGAMEPFRRGADRPDALRATWPRTRESNQLLMDLIVGNSLADLALLEASRREEAGEMAEAWDWYRAVLRAAHHVGLRGTIDERSAAEVLRGVIRERAGAWAADRLTTPAMLRRALDDAIACEALMPRESDSLRAEYLGFEEDLYGPDVPVPAIRRVISGLRDGRVWRRERERSLRVIRLAIANWVAYEDLPPDRRPAPSPDVSGPFDFYELGPEAPAGARALSPRALARWLSTAPDAQRFLRDRSLRAVRIRERSGHRALVVLLATELYRRDHGTDPPDEQALVGPYLKALPDDGLGDGDESTDRGGSNPIGGKR